jgi:hypothetical protein
MNNNWEFELCEEKPNEFTLTDHNTYIQREDIHEIEYHSLDGYQTFKGYECRSREITTTEYASITNQI